MSIHADRAQQRANLVASLYSPPTNATIPTASKVKRIAATSLLLLVFVGGVSLLTFVAMGGWSPSTSTPVALSTSTLLTSALAHRQVSTIELHQAGSTGTTTMHKSLTSALQDLFSELLNSEVRTNKHTAFHPVEFTLDVRFSEPEEQYTLVVSARHGLVSTLSDTDWFGMGSETVWAICVLGFYVKLDENESSATFESRGRGRSAEVAELEAAIGYLKRSPETIPSQSRTRVLHVVDLAEKALSK